MTNLDLTEAVEAAAYALDPDVFDAADIVPGIRSARADACEDAHRAIRAALPHILEALATEAQAETFDDAVWCRCVSETDPADCSECTPRLSSNWLRAKAEETA